MATLEERIAALEQKIGTLTPRRFPQGVDQVAVLNLLDKVLVGVNADGSAKVAAVNQIANLISSTVGSGIEPTVEPNTTLPAPAQAGKIMIMKAGNYTQPGGGSLTAPDKSFNVGYWDGEVWSIDISIETEADLSGYATTNGLNLVDQKTTQNKTILDKYFEDDLTSRGESYPGGVGWLNTTSNFSGWETPCGSPTGFNGVRFMIRSRANPITQISVRIRSDNTGDVLVQRDLFVNVPANTQYEVVCVFDSVVDNPSGDRLLFGFICNDLVDRYGTSSTTIYPNPPWSTFGRYASNGNMNWSLVNVTGSTTYINKAFFFFRDFAISTDLVDGIKSAVPDLNQVPLLAQKTNTAIDLVPKIGNARESYAENAQTNWFFLDSTFSGWATPIGIASNIKFISFKLRARANALTSIYYELRQADRQGTILASGTQSISVLPFQEATILIELPAVVVGGVELYFGFKANSFVDLWGNTTGSGGIVYPRSTYGDSAYAVNGNQTPGFVSVSTSQSNFPVITGDSATVVTAPTAEFANEIKQAIGVVNPNVEVILPSRVYGLVGLETNIYFDSIIYSDVPVDQLDINVTCSIGKQMQRRFTVVPTSGGSFPITISVSKAGVELATVTSSINVAVADSGNGVTRRVNNWGDSTLASGQPLAIIIADQVGDPMTITFVGTKGSGANRHEGRSGYNYGDYGGTGRTLYEFVVSGLGSNPGVGSVWSVNSSQYTVEEVNITSGSGYFRCRRSSGSTTPPASGTLTKVSGSGPTTIAYNSTSTESGNPMWNGSAVDYGYYLTQGGLTMAANDWITFHLGINDVFNFFNDQTLEPKINSVIGYMRAIANSVHAVSGVRLAFMTPIPPSISQDAFGNNYNNGQTLERYWRNITRLQKRIIDEFDNDTERSNGTYLIPYSAVVDRVNNFPFSMQAANSRTTEEVRVYTNGVHPASTGYNQMGDQLRAFLKNMA